MSAKAPKFYFCVFSDGMLQAADVSKGTNVMCS
jgi:hypothetical protein